MKAFVYKHSGFAAFIWTLVIFILCATPGQYIPSSSWLELLSVDKFVHAGIFFVLLSLFFFYATKNNNTSLPILYFVLCILYGGLLELMQATCFSNRSADWLDIVANSCGCTLAFLFKKQVNTFMLT